MANIVLWVVVIAVLMALVGYALKKYRAKVKLEKSLDEEKNICGAKIALLYNALSRLKECKTLTDLLNLHKSLCVPLDLNDSKNLGPCSWGIFRTKDISTMSGDEVFLGDIYGLWTNSLTFWENCSSTMAGNGFGVDPNVLCKDLIFKQYYKHLESNFEAMQEQMRSRIYEINVQLA